MKLIKKTLIATAVASALLASTSAMAVWTGGPATTRDVIIQSTLNTTGIAANVGDAAFTLSSAPQQALTVNDQVIFTLTGGAKFTAVPRLFIKNPNTGLETEPNSFDGFFAADGVTPSAGSGPVIKFHMTDSVIAGSVLRLNTNTGNNGDPVTGIFDLSGVSVAGTVDVNITTKNVVGNIINAIDHVPLAAQSTSDGLVNLFTGNNLLSCSGAQVASATNTAEVTTGFRFFNNGATTIAGTPLTYTTFNNAISPPKAIGAGRVLYKLVGDFNGITGVTATGVTGSDNLGAAATGSTVGQFLINTAKTEAYATNTAAIAGGTAIALAPQFTINGTTAQSARSFDLTTSVLADTANSWAAHNVSCDPASYTVVRNGSSFVVNFFGSANNLRITDVSGSIIAATGKINITAYNQQGGVVALAAGSTFTAAPLGPRETRIIKGADLLAAYPNATHFEFAVESPAIEASSLKIVNGAVTSTSVYTNKALTGGI